MIYQVGAFIFLRYVNTEQYHTMRANAAFDEKYTPMEKKNHITRGEAKELASAYKQSLKLGAVSI